MMGGMSVMVRGLSAQQDIFLREKLVSALLELVEFNRNQELTQHVKYRILLPRITNDDCDRKN